MSRTPWIVTHDGTRLPSMTIECQRCGENYRPTLPISVDMFSALANAFIKQHRECQTRALAPRRG